MKFYAKYEPVSLSKLLLETDLLHKHIDFQFVIDLLEKSDFSSLSLDFEESTGNTPTLTITPSDDVPIVPNDPVLNLPRKLYVLALFYGFMGDESKFIKSMDEIESTDIYESTLQALTIGLLNFTDSKSLKVLDYLRFYYPFITLAILINHDKPTISQSLNLLNKFDVPKHISLDIPSHRNRFYSCLLTSLYFHYVHVRFPNVFKPENYQQFFDILLEALQLHYNHDYSFDVAESFRTGDFTSENTPSDINGELIDSIPVDRFSNTDFFIDEKEFIPEHGPHTLLANNTENSSLLHTCTFQNYPFLYKAYNEGFYDLLGESKYISGLLLQLLELVCLHSPTENSELFKHYFVSLKSCKIRVYVGFIKWVLSSLNKEHFGFYFSYGKDQSGFDRHNIVPALQHFMGGSSSVHINRRKQLYEYLISNRRSSSSDSVLSTHEKITLDWLISVSTSSSTLDWKDFPENIPMDDLVRLFKGRRQLCA
eukprot:CAMPEP_0117419910 /NCGR_PEP_ID=MMETSP0758-20121206/1373_1 /TAXON_ID=63605 /ORGANISM="Percolomonas cosmopolitus, Strain AE-1 (ATCC 50343)" /LENGTH=481 /DNA_ID=CAMNT_0005201249 /DNA_START=1888 /DNA_END=3333 /DNA_ORIENTATION=+